MVRYPFFWFFYIIIILLYLLTILGVPTNRDELPVLPHVKPLHLDRAACMLAEMVLDVGHEKMYTTPDRKNIFTVSDRSHYRN